MPLTNAQKYPNCNAWRSVISHISTPLVASLTEEIQAHPAFPLVRIGALYLREKKRLPNPRPLSISVRHRLTIARLRSVLTYLNRLHHD